MPSKVEDLQDDVPNNINPYKVLEIEKSAISSEIRNRRKKLKDVEARMVGDFVLIFLFGF